MSNRMNAIVMEATGCRDRLQYKEIEIPTLKPGQVLVRLKASPVNFIDTIIREGNMPPGMMPELPFVPGVEGAGVVEESHGTSLKIGQKVAFLGSIGASTYAEYAAVDHENLIELPDNVNLLEAGAMPVTYFTAYHMLHNVARVKGEGFALVYAGTGGVGTALIQLAKLAGLKVIGLERTKEKLTTVLEIGADYALQLQSGWTDRVVEITGGRGVNYIFNPVAGDTISDDLKVLATLGHIVIFGFLAGQGESNMQAEVVKHFSKAPTISYSEIYATYFNNFPLVKKSLETIYSLLEQEKIAPRYQSMPLEQAAKAHELIESGKVTGKLILEP